MGCPRCEIRSCSLACVQEHKKNMGCDGKRDKVKFKRKGEMDDMDLVSDFRLLEEVGRGLDQCRRDKIKRSTRQGTEVMRAPRLPRQLMRLQQEARSRGVKLQILPSHFVRRKENSTVFKAKMRQIFWKVELVFPHCQGGQRSVNLPMVSERTKLWRLVEEQVEGGDEKEDDFILYKSLSYGGLSFYLKGEGMTGRNEKIRRFYPLDLKRSLKTNLQGAMIVEHPVIHVVSKAEEMNYREKEEDDMEDGSSMKVDSVIAADDGETGGLSGGVQDPELGRGDILSAPDAMALDPEGYKRHFDFYLKYYSTKMRLQGAPSNHPVQMLLGKQTGPPPSAHPVQMLLKPGPSPLLPPAPFSHGPGTYSQPKVPPPIFSANYVPDFNRPPPNFSRPPPSFPAPPPNINKVTPPPNISQTPSYARSSPSSLSASNVEAATSIKKELKASAGLGLLSAYCGSDSGSESDSD